MIYLNTETDRLWATLIALHPYRLIRVPYLKNAGPMIFWHNFIKIATISMKTRSSADTDKPARCV